MLFQSVALLALLGAAQAKPTARSPVTLNHDDVLVLRDGDSPLVMKKWDYSLEQDKREVQRRKANIKETPAIARRASNGRRGCEESTEVQVLEETDFTNWDVTMSPVIANTGSTAAMVSVAQGYSLANSVSVCLFLSSFLSYLHPPLSQTPPPSSPPSKTKRIKLTDAPPPGLLDCRRDAGEHPHGVHVHRRQ